MTTTDASALIDYAVELSLVNWRGYSIAAAQVAGDIDPALPVYAYRDAIAAHVGAAWLIALMAAYARQAAAGRLPRGTTLAGEAAEGRIALRRTVVSAARAPMAWGDAHELARVTDRLSADEWAAFCARFGLMTRAVLPFQRMARAASWRSRFTAGDAGRMFDWLAEYVFEDEPRRAA